MSFSAAGKTSTIRSIVFAADEVMQCAEHEVRSEPAAVRPIGWFFQIAHFPTRITSGSPRNAERSALQ